MNKRAYRACCSYLLVALGVSWAGVAAAEGMEERLRTQLRSTTQQLQALQSEQAQASAAGQLSQSLTPKPAKSCNPSSLSIQPSPAVCSSQFKIQTGMEF